MHTEGAAQTGADPGIDREVDSVLFEVNEIKHVPKVLRKPSQRPAVWVSWTISRALPIHIEP